MAAVTQRTIVAVFNDRASAQKAINELKRQGFRDDQIGVTSRRQEGHGDDDDGEETYAGEGGATGLAAGAGIGALWGLGIISGLLPAIGPAIAGGTLAAILSSAAAGAAAAGFAGMLIGLGVPKDEAEYYEGELKAGRTIVTVQPDGRHAEALMVLRQHGGYERGTDPSQLGGTAHEPIERESTRTTSHSVLEGDMAGRGETLPQGSSYSEGVSSSGARGYAENSPFASSAESHSTGPEAYATGAEGYALGERHGNFGQETAQGQHTIQAREEQLQVEKERRQVGDVHVRKEVHTEHKTLEVPVEREEVVIERRPGGGQAAGDFDEHGQEIRIPVSEEHVNVEKVPVVKEEVNIGKRKVTENKQVSGTVRSEEIKVEADDDIDVRDRGSQR